MTSIFTPTLDIFHCHKFTENIVLLLLLLLLYLHFFCHKNTATIYHHSYDAMWMQ